MNRVNMRMFGYIYCLLHYYFFFALSSQSGFIFGTEVNLQLIFGNKNTYTIIVIFLYTKIKHALFLILVFRETGE